MGLCPHHGRDFPIKGEDESSRTQMEVTIPGCPLREGGRGVLYVDQALSTKVCAEYSPALQQKHTSAQTIFICDSYRF